MLESMLHGFKMDPQRYPDIAYLVYNRLLRETPTATVRCDPNLNVLGQYDNVQHVCKLRPNQGNYMLTVLGHELCHSMARHTPVTYMEEARVELFELAFSKYLEQSLNEPFRLNLPDRSVLKPYESELLELPVHTLLQYHHNIERTLQSFNVPESKYQQLY